MDKTSGNEEDPYQRPAPNNFDAYLPWACNQLQLDATIVIIKIFQNEYISAALSDRSRTKEKIKAKIAQSRADFDSDQTKDGKSEYELPVLVSPNKIVRILTVYDSCENLVQIKFDKNMRIPQLVLKIIGLIIEFQIYLTKITINRGMDWSTLYEICKFLPRSHITDICLDNTFLSEANYHILLEKPNALRQLSLSRCRIDDKVVGNIVSKLSYAMPSSNSLSVLNLSSNRITDVGARYLGELLRFNRQLSYLNLSNNTITDDGAAKVLDNLKEFPLTWEELQASRARHIIYLKEKNDHISRMVKELQAGDFDKRAAKRKSTRPVSSVSGKKIKGLDKESSLKSVPESNVKSHVNMNVFWYEKAESMVDNVMGEFDDPFSTKNTVVKDGGVYCYGNNTLCHLNLAYNNLTYFTVKKLLSVMMCQKLLDRKPRGLINLSIEGNCLPINCKELTQLNEALDVGLMAHNRRLSVAKKRPAPKSGGR